MDSIWVRRAVNILRMLAEMEERLSTGFSRGALAVLFVLILLGAGLRLYNLGGQGLGLDENYTLLFASGQASHYFGQGNQSAIMDTKAFRDDLKAQRPAQPVAVIEGAYRYEPSHTPLYYVVANLALAVFGISEFGLRLPSVLFGTLTIPFLFLLGMRLHSAAVGLLAAAFFALAPYQVYFGQEARMYSMAVFFAVSATWVLVDLSFRRQEGGNGSNFSLWGAFVLLSAVGLYTHYFFAFILGVQLLFMMTMHLRDQAFLKRGFIAVGVVTLMYLPWILARLLQADPPGSGMGWLHGHGEWTVPGLILAAAKGVLGFVWTAELRSYRAAFWFWVVMLILGIWAVRRRAGLWLLPVWIAVPPAAVVLIDYILGTHASSYPRYYMLAAPAFYLLLALGVVTIRPFLLSCVLAGVSMIYLAVGGYWTAEGQIYPRWEFKAAGQEIARETRPDDLVIVTSHLSKHVAMLLSYYMAWPEKVIKVSSADVTKIDLMPFYAQIEPHHQVVLVLAEIGHPERFDPRSVTTACPDLELVESQRYVGLWVFRYYRKESAGCSTAVGGGSKHDAKYFTIAPLAATSCVGKVC